MNEAVNRPAGPARGLDLIDLAGPPAIFLAIVSVDKSTLDQLRIDRSREREHSNR